MTTAYAVFDKWDKLVAIYLNELAARRFVDGTTHYVEPCKLNADGCHIQADSCRIVPDEVLVPEWKGSGGPGR